MLKKGYKCADYILYLVTVYLELLLFQHLCTAFQFDCFHSQHDDQTLDLAGCRKTCLSFLELQKLEMKCMFSEQGLIYLITACVNLSQQRTLFLTTVVELSLLGC